MIYHIDSFLLFLRREAVPTLCVIAIALSGLYSLVISEPTRAELDATVDARAKIQGILIKDPDRRENTTHITVRVEEVNGVKVAQTDTRLLVFADTFFRGAYGDRVLVNGIVKKPTPFETESGRTFDYPKYLLAHGIGHTMSFPEIEILENGKGNPVVATLLSIKHGFIRGIQKALPEPESALLAGLLIGEQQSLGERITEAFRGAGVVHIIVLSGYNVALVMEWVTCILLVLLPRGWAYGAAGIFVIAFAVMTGASETTIRAVIMALLMMLATVLHRPAAALRGLCIAAGIMAIWNPYVVLYDLSFQLSVLATLGLVLFSDKIATRIEFVPDFKYFPMREIVATTLATQATVLPLLILSVGAVSLVFLPANVLVLPAVPIAMFVGFFASLAALFLGALALPFSFFAYAILHYIVAVAVWFGSLPFALLHIPGAWTGWILLFLTLLYGAVLFRFRKRIFSRPALHSSF